MKLADTFTHLEALFSASEVYVWIMEYGITHHVMRLAIHTGTYPRGTEVICGDCDYFAGPLQGGPYRVRLSVEETPAGPQVKMIGNDGQLVLTCGRIRVSRVRQ